MKQSKTSLAIFWITAIAAAVFLFLPTLLPGVFVSVLSFPFVQIRTLLTLLAGTGRFGNGAALALLAGCTAAPLILILAADGLRRDRITRAAGIVLTAVFGIGYYMLWNTGRIFPELSLLPQGKAICFSGIGTMMWSGVIGFLTILWIRHIPKCGTHKLIGYASAALSAIGGVIVAAACVPVLSAAAGIAGNSGFTAAQTVTLFCSLLSLIPAVFIALAVYAAAEALNAYRENDVECALSLAGITERRCIRALILSVSAALVRNLTVILFNRILGQANISADIPLFDIAIVLAVLLVSRLVQRNKQLSDDNDLFI